VFAFIAGYFVATQKTENAIAVHEVQSLMHYTPALAYLQNGQTENAKNILYTGIDGSLGTLSKSNTASLSPTDSKALKSTLVQLNQLWDKDKPFENEKSASLKTIPEWVEMRLKNDAFRNDYANKQ
jgi:hypothetical protein